MGWKKVGAAIVPGHQIIAATYIKGDDKITYDGTDWVLNGVQKITNQSQVPNNET